MLNRKSNKYHAQKVLLGKNRFDSKKECCRSIQLDMLLRAGKISNLERQKRFELVPRTALERPVFYLADFYYFDNELNKWVVEDVKSAVTKKLAAYIIKRKLMRWRYPEIKFIES